jgi:hypothetical protein
MHSTITLRRSVPPAPACAGSRQPFVRARDGRRKARGRFSVHDQQMNHYAARWQECRHIMGLGWLSGIGAISCLVVSAIFASVPIVSVTATSIAYCRYFGGFFLSLFFMGFSVRDVRDYILSWDFVPQPWLTRCSRCGLPRDPIPEIWNVEPSDASNSHPSGLVADRRC